MMMPRAGKMISKMIFCGDSMMVGSYQCQQQLEAINAQRIPNEWAARLLLISMHQTSPRVLYVMFIFLRLSLTCRCCCCQSTWFCRAKSVAFMLADSIPLLGHRKHRHSFGTMAGSDQTHMNNMMMWMCYRSDFGILTLTRSSSPSTKV